MLPPPVPAKHRPLTPVSVDSTSSASPPVASGSIAMLPDRPPAVHTPAVPRKAQPSSEPSGTKRAATAPVRRVAARPRRSSVSATRGKIEDDGSDNDDDADYVPRTPSRSTTPASALYHKRPATTSAPRRPTRIERELARVARSIDDDAGYEWGLDDEVGEELGRLGREGSVVKFLE